MRIWHEKLIPLLPNAQLGGQHNECCAMRGLSWGRKHSVVDYVWKYSPMRLVIFHKLIMAEMHSRKYWKNIDPIWLDNLYRGKRSPPWTLSDYQKDERYAEIFYAPSIYPEHNNIYLEECLDNLREKGVIINVR